MTTCPCLLWILLSTGQRNLIVRISFPVLLHGHPNMFDDVINQFIEKDVLYLAKEPGDGVMTDIQKLSVKNNVTIVDAEGCYGDYYRKMGYNVISRVKYFELDGTMRFDVVIGNMPFQDSSNTQCTESVSHFWSKALDLSKDDGIVCYISPSTWCSPSRDFKSPKYGHKGDVRLWDHSIVTHLLPMLIYLQALQGCWIYV